MGKEKIIPALAKFIGLGTKAAKAVKTKKVVKLSKTVLDKTRESLKTKKLKSGTGTQTGKNTVEWNIPPVKKPIVKKPVVKPPVVKTPVKKVTSKPVVKKPAVKKPVVKPPVVKTPVKKTPVKKTPVVKAPVVKAPVVKAPVKKPAVKKPVVAPPVKKPPVKKPPVKKPPVKKPKTTEPTPKVKDTSYSGTNTDTRAGKIAAYAGKKADAIGKGVAGVIKAPVKGVRYIYRNPKKAIVPAAIAAVLGYGYNQNRKYNAMLKLIEGKNKPGNKPKTIYDDNLMKVDTTGQASYNKKQKLKPRNNSAVDSTAYKKAQANLDRLLLLKGKNKQ